MEVHEVTDREQWNMFLAYHPRGHLLQSYEWGELHRYLGGNIYRLGALENGRLMGTMQLSVTPVPLPLSLPGAGFKWLYCVRGPAVEYPNVPALTALLERAHAIAQHEHAIVLRLEPNIIEDEPDGEAWLAAYHRLGFQTNPYAVHGRRSWILDIQPDIKELFANFRKAWRQNIRIAQREGVVIRTVESEADFNAYYDLLKLTSEREQFFIHSKDYHKQMWQLFARKGDAGLYLAEYQGMVVAAKMVLRFGSWCWDMFGATSECYPRLPKMHLLQYHCLQWAKAQGCTYFDFRTIPERLERDEELWGVYHYKRGFGGFSRLSMPTQDYVYHPLLYNLWRKVVEVRRRTRRATYKVQHARA